MSIDFKKNSMNKKVKFITAIYSDLHGTEFGGRPSRGSHYRWSLLSLLKMTDADFICYTSDRELDSLIDFFYKENNVSEEQLKFKVSDLSEIKYKDIINKFKKIDEVIHSDRCFEIQYNKFFWWWDEDKTYDYYFWIDAGLSHCGLIPDVYLPEEHAMKKYYDSTLFNNLFLSNLIDFSDDRFLLLAKENSRNYWCGTVNQKWYKNYENNLHIIGGLFGGKKDLWDNVVSIFENYFVDIANVDNILYNEEVIMSLMYFNHKELFKIKEFDVWLHKDNYRDAPSDYFEVNKSFYKILEELNAPRTL